MYTNKSHLFRSQFEKELKEFFNKPIKELTAESVLYYLYGDYSDGRDTRDCEQEVVYKYGRNVKASFLQRLSRIVFVPLVLLTLPFVWIVSGEWGWDSNWKISKIIHKLTGL